LARPFLERIGAKREGMETPAPRNLRSEVFRRFSGCAGAAITGPPERGQRLSGPADLAQLMTNLNFLIHEASPDNRYATFFYGELDPATRRLDYVNAGHNAPMIFRAAGGIERLRATGPVVGLVEAGRFEQRSVVLSAGDVLLVYSDGISEAMNRDDEEWGEDELALAAGAASPCGARELIDKLFVAADAHVAGAMQHDDMTVVAVRMKA